MGAEFPVYLGGVPARTAEPLVVTIDTGGIIVNDVPTWRIDNMPCGGVKDSGLGRQGPRYTIEEMTEPRLLVINRRPHR